jgi:hypothetical protein
LRYRGRGEGVAKDAYYFSHDSNARSDPKIMALINNYGIEGYGRWWVVVEMLREQSDYRLKHCEWSTNALAMAMLCDTNSAEKFIHDCINRFELLESDDEHFWSNSLLRRMEMREEKRQKRVDAGRKGAEIRWSDSKAIAMPKQSHSDTIAMDSKERKGNESKEKGKTHSDGFEEFWSHYPRKEGKDGAYKHFKRLLKDHTPAQLITSAKNYAIAMKDTDKKYIKRGYNFFGDGLFMDYLEEKREPVLPYHRPYTATDVARKMSEIP